MKRRNFIGAVAAFFALPRRFTARATDLRQVRCMASEPARFRVFTEAVLSALGSSLPPKVHFVDHRARASDPFVKFDMDKLQLPDTSHTHGYTRLPSETVETLMDEYRASASAATTRYMVKAVSLYFLPVELDGGRQTGVLVAKSESGDDAPAFSTRVLSVPTAVEVAVVLSGVVPPDAVVLRPAHVERCYGVESIIMSDGRACVRTIVGSTVLSLGVRERLFLNGPGSNQQFVSVDMLIGVPE